MATFRISSGLTLFFLLSSACGGTKQAPPENSGAASTTAPNKTSENKTSENKTSENKPPAVEAPPDSSEKPPPSSETAPQASPFIAPPPAQGAIGGISISEVAFEDVLEVAQKLGWKPAADAKQLVLQSKGREARSITLAKGQATAELKLIRPIPGLTPAKDSNIADPKSVADFLKESSDTAFYEEGEVLVQVTIQGKKADAQKLLEGLMKKPKK